MKKLLFISLVSLLCSTGFSQRYVWDFGGKVGAANGLTEIGGDEKTRRDFIWDMKFQETNFSLGGFGRYKINNMVSVNAALMWYRISGDDALSSNPGRRGRNLSYRNDLFDLSVRGELYLYNVNDVGNKGRYRMDFKSFLFAGFSGFMHNPKARNPEYNGGAWTSLRPLRTEGQSKEYSKFVAGIPLGLGFYFTYRRQHRFGWELGTNLTFTDYLDDVSSTYPDVADVDPVIYDMFTNRSDELAAGELPGGGLGNYAPGEKRGDPTNKDAIVYTHLTYSYVLRGKNSSFYRQNFGWIGNKRGGRRKVRAKF